MINLKESRTKEVYRTVGLHSSICLEGQEKSQSRVLAMITGICAECRTSK
jgi:hypothetical protein